MPKTYTAKQKDVIARAFVALRIIVQTDSKADQWLDEAYRYERRQRSSKAYTEAVIVETFLKGWHGEIAEAHAVFGFSDGCGKAFVLGAQARYERARANVEGYEQRRFLITEAHEALLHMAHEAQQNYYRGIA